MKRTATAFGFSLLAVPLALATSLGQTPRDSSFQSIARLENEHVRAMENIYPAGASSPVHTHPDPRAFYVIEGGRVELVAEDGTVTRLELIAGQTGWRPSETHTVRNVGSTRIRVLEVEIKAAGRE